MGGTEVGGTEVGGTEVGATEVGAEVHLELSTPLPRVAQFRERHALEVLEALHVEGLPGEG